MTAARPGDSPTSAFERARRAFPGVVLDEGQLAGFLAERGLDAGTLPEDRLRDCFVVCAALHGAPGGVAALEGHLAGPLRAALRKTRISADEADDVLQRLWSTLLVDDGQGQGQRLAAWQGQGDLLAYVRVSAVRLALKLRRASGKEQPQGDELLQERADALTPELAYMKESYRASFRVAFQAALDSLPSRDQLLLRQQVLDGLTVDELGALHGVHRATVARWIASARETLIARARRRFFADVALPPEEGEGLMSLVQSRLDETIRRRLLLAG